MATTYICKDCMPGTRHVKHLMFLFPRTRKVSNLCKVHMVMRQQAGRKKAKEEKSLVPVTQKPIEVVAKAKRGRPSKRLAKAVSPKSLNLGERVELLNKSLQTANASAAQREVQISAALRPVIDGMVSILQAFDPDLDSTPVRIFINLSQHPGVPHEVRVISHREVGYSA